MLSGHTAGHVAESSVTVCCWFSQAERMTSGTCLTGLTVRGGFTQFTLGL